MGWGQQDNPSHTQNPGTTGAGQGPGGFPFPTLKHKILPPLFSVKVPLTNRSSFLFAPSYPFKYSWWSYHRALFFFFSWKWCMCNEWKLCCFNTRNDLDPATRAFLQNLMPGWSTASEHSHLPRSFLWVLDAWHARAPRKISLAAACRLNPTYLKSWLHRSPALVI